MKNNPVLKVLAIDPGTTDSAYVIWDGFQISGKGIWANEFMLEMLREEPPTGTHLVIEEIKSYGMPVGVTTFQTVWWSGRFYEAWPGCRDMMPRLAVKMHLCHNGHAKDANVRQALIDRFGKPGTKKAPGLLYGVKKDIWAALGLAVCFWDRLCEV